MKWKLALGVFALVCFALPQNLSSTTVQYMDDENLTKNADQIFTGQVLSKKSYWTKDKKRIYTLYKISVTKKFKGKIVNTIQVIKQWGGQVDKYKYHIAGIATFKTNEETFSFFTPANSQGFRLTVGLAQGKLEIKRNREGRRYLLRNTVGLHFRQKNKVGQVEVIRDYDGYEKKISAFVAKHKRK